MRPPGHVVLVTAVATGVCLLLGACGTSSGDTHGSASPLWSTTPSSTARDGHTAEPAATAPLTGVGTDEKTAAHPAVAVAVADRSGSSAPVGLSTADLVYEEFSGHESSHLLAVYQSRTARKVGPVDITRPVDIKLLPVLHPAYAYSGGPLGFAIQVDRAGLAGVNRVSKPKAFSGSGSATYTSTARALEEVDHLHAPPPVFTHADGDTPLTDDAKKATKATVTVPGEQAQAWTYDAEHKVWQRTSGTGAKVEAANLVVQHTKYKTVRNKHVAGGSTESALATGTGDCEAFSGGRSASCTWSRPGREKQTNYADSTSASLEFRQGATWVLLAPPGTKVKAS